MRELALGYFLCVRRPPGGPDCAALLQQVRFARIYLWLATEVLQSYLPYRDIGTLDPTPKRWMQLGRDKKGLARSPLTLASLAAK